MRRCQKCGAPVAAGEKACPKGHPLAGEAGGQAGGDGEGSTIGLDLSKLADAETAPRPPPSRPSTLFECEPCGRLVETQEHEGRVIVPVFCPWCGKQVDPIVGREIDGYEVGDLLAQGGFGLVYLASNVAEPKMKAVIKFLRPRMGYLQPSLIRVFVEEARLTEEIGQTCWNVARVSNVRERPWPYFFMEYIRGTTLDQVLRSAKDKRIPIEDAKGYLRGIAKALAATHAHGRVHRDLKPLNIMVIQSQEIRAEERIKLIDFGLSMKIARGRTSFEGATSAFDDGTAAGHSPIQSAGTPEYMPPEAFDGLNEFAGDVYSFGITAYEILTGETPWTQPPNGSQRFFYWRDTHKKSPPRPIREVRPEVPGWLANVVMKCLAKDPNQRIRTADELISRLREPLPRWVWAAAGAATLLFAILLGFALKGGAEVRDPLWTVSVGEDDGQGVKPLYEESRENPVRLWVNEPADLARRKITLKVNEGKILDAAPSSPHVVCKVEDGSVEIRFREGPGLASLVGSQVTIDGRGSGFRVQGALEVGSDTMPPVLGEVGIIDLESSQSPPEVRPLPPVNRFHSKKVALAVPVEEDHLHEIHLTFDRLWDIDAIDPIRGVFAGKGLWRFPLDGLRPGDYKAVIEAVDGAQHRVGTEYLEFIVDDTPELRISIKDPIIAAGRAIYVVEGVEPLASVVVEGEGVTGSAIHDIATRNPLEIGRRIAASPKVKPHEIETLEPYLLAVAVNETAEGPFDLVLTDTATPQNTNKAPGTLSFSAPAPLDAKADIDSITVEFDDEGGEPPSLVALSPDFRFPAPARFTRVSRLEASFKTKYRIHAMTLELDGTKREGHVDDRSATVRDFDLKGSPGEASTENKLVLTFQDPLERSLPLELSLATDRRPPAIRFRHKSGEDLNPTNHQVKSWSEVSMWIEAENEKLSRAQCTMLGKQVPVDLEPGGMRATLSTSGLQATEGKHAFDVDVWDIAGNRAQEDVKVVLNLGPPRIEPIGKKDENSGLRVLTDPFSFKVIDGNKPLDYERAEVVFYVDGRATPIPVTIPWPSEEGGDIHAVSLMGLPNDAKGTLIVRIADQFKRQSEYTEGFSFTRPQEKWKPLVEGWNGMDWVYVVGRDGREYYISRTEVPNKVYLAHYRKAQAGASQFWGEGGKLPAYTKDGEPVDNPGDFPVVGITWNDAEKVALALGGRLPLVVEWLDAAWKENPGGHYPWKNGEAGQDFANCHKAWDRPSSPFSQHHYDRTMKYGRNEEAGFRAVEVDFDPWPESVKKDLRYAGDILHMIGNVGEFVLMEDGSRGIAGGGFDDSYDAISLLRGGGVTRVYNGPRPDTGFRVVIPLVVDTSEEFKKAARNTGRK